MRSRGGWLAYALLAVVTAAGVQAQGISSPPLPVASTTNVVYGMHGGLALLLDVYAPTVPSNRRGVLVIPGSGFHGPVGYGGPAMKESRAQRQMADTLAAAGYTVFVVNHRLAPVFRYPAPVDDVRRAVRFVRAHAESFGIAPEWLGVTGGSSGANLAALLGAGSPPPVPDSPDPVDRVSASVQAVVAVAAPADLTMPVANPLAAVLLTSYFGVPVFPGPNMAPGTRRLLAGASPALQVREGAAPMLLAHGDADTVVPFEQAEALAAALARAGVAHRLLRIPGGTHDELRPPGAVDYLRAAVEWFDAHLLGAPARHPAP